MKRELSIVYVSLMCISMVSCENKHSNTAELGVSESLVIENVSTTSFTSSLTGQFKGITNLDIVLGKHGVLFCVKSDQAESIFKSWQKGNDDAECLVYTNKNGFNGESYKGTIEGLLPDTEYSFCLFSQNRDESTREISDVHTFKTLAFNPVINQISIKEIHYNDADTEIEFGMNPLDAELCEYGIMLSESSNIDVNTANRVINYTDMYEPKISIKIKDLKPDKSYCGRAYVRYQSSEDKEAYMYGPEILFSTMNSDQMYVDLGLPSGIKWANCDLGDYTFSNYAYSAPCYMWGSLRDVLFYMDPDKGFEIPSDVKYEQIDVATGNYKDLGSNISGTEYDIAKLKLGGKWRMPTISEIEELINLCEHTTETDNRTYTNNGQQHTIQVGIHILSNNNNAIKFLDREYYWCGDAVDSDKAKNFQFTKEKQNAKINYWDSDRTAKCKIRPVWDPNVLEE